MAATYFCQRDEAGDIKAIMDHIPGKDVIVLKSDRQHNEHPGTYTIVQYFLYLLRQNRLHKNKREMLLGSEDLLVAIQLSLAQHNKDVNTDFDVEASSVVEFQKKLVNLKLADSSAEEIDNESTTKYQIYEEFLKFNNVFDHVDLYKRVQSELDKNEELRNKLQNTNYVILCDPKDKIEESMLRIFCNKDMYKVTIESGLNESFSEKNVVLDKADFDQILSEKSPSLESQPTPRSISVTEAYCEQVFYSYLELLLNTRNEIALARIINVPERDIDHQAFTEIKREAKTKKLSMYQTVTSLVLRVRLGKNYDPNAPIMQHIKGLSEFVDLMHKLQNILEEINNSTSAVKKILNAIKVNILKNRDDLLRKPSVEAVIARLQTYATSLIEATSNATSMTPNKKSHDGGSLVGRKTQQVILLMIDTRAGRDCVVKPVDVLSDVYSSQNTPLRFPSLMSKFKSPLEGSPGGIETQPLSMRLSMSFTTPVSKKIVPRYKASMDWAMPEHHIQWNQNDLSPIPMIDTEKHTSKTIVEQGKQENGNRARKILESINDQENLDEPLPDIIRIENQKNNSEQNRGKKRPITELGSQPDNKKAKKQEKTKSKSEKTKSKSAKTGNKKSMAPQKGQKTITGFFRI